MSDQEKLRFLPWLRIGAAGAIADKDALAGSLAANATLRPWVRIAGHAAIEQPAALRGPGHVTALGPQAIIRIEPVAGTRDFEPNYFPFIEMRPADLPWRFTPAAPGDRNQLRPWLVLVVVRQQAGVALVAEPAAKLPVLRIEAPAVPSVELPDLSDSAAWVHVQTSLPIDAVVDALETDPDAALARLVCPRRLLPDTTWLACLVPAFDVGVRAALGEGGASAAQAAPAWDLASIDAGVVRLPVFHSWSFSTGPDGDFEALARRLAPDEGETRLGRVGLDVADPGPPLPSSPARAAVIADFVGALRSRGVARGPITQEHRKWLETSLEKLVESGVQRPAVPAAAPRGYDPARDDPVVAPPLYGALQAARRDVPDKAEGRRAWVRPLNLMPEFRAIAGLGAAVVRANQEALVASAWSQAGALREAMRGLDTALLSVEIGRSVARRIGGLEPGATLQATHRMHAWIASPASPGKLAADLRLSEFPGALVGAGFARATRPRGALSRAWSKRVRDRKALAASTETMLAATSATAPAVVKRAVDFALTSLPVGAWTHDGALTADATAMFSATTSRPRPLIRAALKASTDARGRISTIAVVDTLADAALAEAGIAQNLSGAVVATVPPRRVLDLSSAAAAVVAALDPLTAISSGLLARIPALSSLGVATGALPPRLWLDPRFTDPLSRDLVRLDSRYLLPGAETLDSNRVALLEADSDFVAAFLAGANHEMSRELIWREFPASPRSTFFHRFWDTGAEGPDDIAEIADWSGARLGDNLTGVGAGALAVILLRGDVVRRYPEMRIYLTRGAWHHDIVLPDPAQISEALMLGRLDRNTIFLGFPVSAQAMRGARGGASRDAADAGWFLTLEEPAQGPRFGLDAAADDGSDLTKGAASWGDLSWGHLVEPRSALDDLSFVLARKPLPARNAGRHGRILWGHNAAHMAAITWQRPFRLQVHADRLLPPVK